MKGKALPLLSRLGLALCLGLFAAAAAWLWFGCQQGFREAYRQEIYTVQRIAGHVAKEAPGIYEELEPLLLEAAWQSGQDEEQSVGLGLLAKYGYDTDRCLAENRTYQSALGKILAGLGCLAALGLLLALLAFGKERLARRRQLRLLLGVAEEYLSEDYSFSLSPKSIGGGDRAALSNRLGDTLKQLGSQIRLKNSQMNEEKESTKALVTDISHQLKTPIASLRTCFELYLEAESPEEKQEFLNRSQIQIDKLQNLTEALMNISKLETAMITLTREEVSLRDTLMDAVNGIYDKAQQKGIAVEMEAFEDQLLLLDRKWTAEAVMNVLDNAVKYSPENSVIRIVVRLMPAYLRLEIRDEGIGVPKTERNQIFQRFFRGTREEVRAAEGSGVGLYLTRMILEKQGGGISVRSSEPRPGSVFYLQMER